MEGAQPTDVRRRLTYVLLASKRIQEEMESWIAAGYRFLSPLVDFVS